MLVNEKILDPAIRSSNPRESKRVQGELVFVLKKFEFTGIDILIEKSGANSSFISMHSSSSERIQLNSGNKGSFSHSKAEILFSPDEEVTFLKENEYLSKKIKEIDQETYLLKCENFRLKKRRNERHPTNILNNL